MFVSTNESGRYGQMTNQREFPSSFSEFRIARVTEKLPNKKENWINLSIKDPFFGWVLCLYNIFTNTN